MDKINIHLSGAYEKEELCDNSKRDQYAIKMIPIGMNNASSMNAMMDRIAEKHWNKKMVRRFEKPKKGINTGYTEKYATTCERLKAKLEARKKN
jgi:hypothetical protein